ncbi:hypothetical protein IJH02_00185 [Candidatus Saccharibacteria bacterium]|nr:hypothetical protein [Candidatus Saccharibacteria bacterium]
MRTKRRRAAEEEASSGVYGVGRTIAEEREKLESSSERIAAREKAKNRQTVSILIFVIGLMVIGVLVVIGVRSLMESGGGTGGSSASAEDLTISAEVIDESGAGITNRVKEFIARVEKDLAELGYTVTRVAVPAGKRREVDVYIDGIQYYIKMNVDRGAGVSAEDADRMIRYIAASPGVEPGYVDVRVEGKAYYK